MVKRGMKVMKPDKPVSNGDPEGTTYRCPRCGRVFNKQKTNFPITHSTLFAGNNYYLPWCYKCVDELYFAYCNDIGLGDKSAIRRLCSRFDYYWSDDVYGRIEMSPATTLSRMRDYMKEINKAAFYGKTYDDTLAEEAEKAMTAASYADDTDANSKVYDGVDPAVIKFWGAGLAPEEYIFLQGRYDDWIDTGRYQNDDPAVQTLLRQICMTEYDIDVGRKTGKQVDKAQSTLNNFLGSLNAKPSQQREAQSTIDQTPMGVWAQRIEETRPIGDPLPEWRDVDGIVKYITVWMFGHLCKMLGIKNRYSEMYEAEIRKYTVDRPEYNEEDDTEDIFDAVFGGDS